VMTKNNKRILVVDFYDSFTYNIVAECKRLFEIYHICSDIQVCPWDKLEVFLTADQTENQVIIWGPGPGTVSEYEAINPVVKKCLDNQQLFNMGICLGHQIILHHLGHKLVLAKRPRHGESISIRLPAWSIYPPQMRGKIVQVQLYNSWVVEGNIQVKNFAYLYYHGAIMGASGKNLLTYQFHPESIGTSFPEIFFLPLINKLCNNGSTLKN